MSCAEFATATQEVETLLTDLQHNLPVVLAFLDERVGVASFFEWENFSDHRIQLAGREPSGKLLPRRFHERAICAQIGQPEAVNACSLRVEKASVELRSFAGGRTIDNYASKIANAAHAFCDMFAAEHFEDRIDALTIG